MAAWLCGDQIRMSISRAPIPPRKRKSEENNIRDNAFSPSASSFTQWSELDQCVGYLVGKMFNGPRIGLHSNHT